MLKRIHLLLILTLLIPLYASAVPGPLEKLGKELDQTAVYFVIMAKFSSDPLLNPFDIKVIVQNDKAILEGVVDTDIQYDRAVTLARATKTIDEVDASNLKIKDSKHPYEDIFITAKIKGMLLKNKYVNGENVAIWPIQMSTKNGIVYVVGTVDNIEQKNNILNVIGRIQGVKEVRSDLKINP